MTYYQITVIHVRLKLYSIESIPISHFSIKLENNYKYISVTSHMLLLSVSKYLSMLIYRQERKLCRFTVHKKEGILKEIFFFFFLRILSLRLKR